MSDNNLDDRLNKALKDAGLDEHGEPKQDKGKSSLSGIARGMQIGIEFAGGAVFGVIFGIFIDKWLDTTPLFTIILLFLGFGAGILNVYRLINDLDASIGVYNQISKKETTEQDNDNG